MNKVFKIFLAVCTGIGAAFVYSQTVIKQKSAGRIYDNIEDVPSAEFAIVLGARVYGSRLSTILKDRVHSAYLLYSRGSVNKILLSGDGKYDGYDELTPMHNYLMMKGVKAEDIIIDRFGLDTYDSIYRAKDLFGVENAVVVTQDFHLPRAVYIGNSMGIKTYGFAADRQTYNNELYNSLRDRLAGLKAVTRVVTNSKSLHSDI